ncbi:interleukin-22 receptor subunit alpha-2 [Neosynchiropus ocellatus]
MTRLLLAVLLLENLCASEQGSVTLTPPAHVRFQSQDYKNVLHWAPGGNSSRLKYSVQWKIYGEPEWLDADGCQEIQKQHCDLSSVTSDLREWYYARVQATSSPSGQSAWVLSPRFSPRWDTQLSPPNLQLNGTRQGIVVRVKAVRLKVSIDLTYRIFLINSDGKEVEYELESHKLVVKKLQRKSKYCVQAQIVIPMHAKSSERSRRECVSTL